MPIRGGTLRYIGHGDVDHIDTAAGNYTSTAMVHRACTRQLVSTPTTDDPRAAGELVADLAERVPTREGGGISPDGLRYTFVLRAGAAWNTVPVRPVTAADVVRGIKRLANPVEPCPLLRYFTGSIRGMAAFAADFARVEPTVAAIAAFVEERDVPGLRALDVRTLEVELVEPTPDLLHVLALPFASPVPVEQLRALPGSRAVDRDLASCGPYAVAEYEPGARLVLDRNPAWRAETDPLRPAYVDRIEIVQGHGQRAAFDAVMNCRADLLWDVPPPTSELAALAADPRLRRTANGMLNPSLLINMHSPNESGALGRVEVRRALQLAVDKAAVMEVYGGPDSGVVADGVLPPWNAAYRPVTRYRTDGDRGDPVRARALLAAAGYPDGLTLAMLHRDAGNHPAVAEVVRTALAAAGVEVQLVAVDQAAFYSDHLADARRARAGEWDIAAQGWLPDWPGDNARSYLQPHFDSSGVADDASTWGACYGCYRGRGVDLIADGIAAPTADAATDLFAQAAQQVMDDAAVVPICWQSSVTVHSERVRGFAGFPSYLGDPTAIWLA